jgi:hypothetical protein
MSLVEISCPHCDLIIHTPSKTLTIMVLTLAILSFYQGITIHKGAGTLAESCPHEYYMNIHTFDNSLYVSNISSIYKTFFPCMMAIEEFYTALTVLCSIPVTQFSLCACNLRLHTQYIPLNILPTGSITLAYKLGPKIKIFLPSVYGNSPTMSE